MKANEKWRKTQPDLRLPRQQFFSIPVLDTPVQDDKKRGVAVDDDADAAVRRRQDAETEL